MEHRDNRETNDVTLPLSLCLDKNHCKDEDESESGVSSGSPGSRGQSGDGQEDGRQVVLVRRSSLSSTPTLDTDSDKSSYSEKQEKEASREEGSNKDSHGAAVHIETGFVTIRSLAGMSDTETYVEQNAMQEETAMVETDCSTVFIQ